jgi:uncharacterized GH25 family protein
MGKVVDDQGKPIAKAEIRTNSYDMMQQNERRKQYTTDENGEFEIPRLAPGEIELIISAKGYLTKRFHANTDSFDFEAVLRPDTGQRLNQVKIVNDNDEPLANIPVHFWLSTRPKDESEYQRKLLKAQTDEQGIAKFEIHLDYDKQVVSRSIIECDVEGYDLAYAGVNPKEEVDVVLKIHKSDQHWQAQVLDAETGKPLPEATAQVRGMQIENSNEFAFFPEEKPVVFQADDQGCIRFERFSMKDRISVDVTAPGYAKEQKWFSSESSSRPTDTTFRLNRAGTITGKMTRTDGGELPEGFRVSLVMTSSRNVRETIHVEKDGTFACDHCTPGSYTVSVYPTTTEGRKFICNPIEDVEVKTGEIVEVVIEMEKGILVRGTMIDPATGKPPADREYAYVRTATGQAYSPIKEDGSWELYVPDGEHQIMYRYKDMKQQKEFKRVKVTKGKPIEGLVIKVGAKSE